MIMRLLFLLFKSYIEVIKKFKSLKQELYFWSWTALNFFSSKFRCFIVSFSIFQRRQHIANWIHPIFCVPNIGLIQFFCWMYPIFRSIQYFTLLDFPNIFIRLFQQFLFEDSSYVWTHAMCMYSLASHIVTAHVET